MVQDRIYSYFERNPQLHVLFIFDRMTIIQTELDEVKEWADGYIYKVFDGAWFNTKYAIENTWKDNKVVLLFTQETYPHNEEQQLKFPLLDMLKANMEYKEEDYASFMQQYNLPEKFRPFIKRNIGEIMSTKISAILNGHLSQDAFSEDVVCRAFISSYLGDKKLLDWENIIVRMIILGGNGEEKKRNEFFNRLDKSYDAKKCVNEKLTKLFGHSYNPNQDVKMKSVAESMKYNSMTQLLDAVPADSYKAYKITNSVILEQINKIYEFGTHDRVLSEKFTNALAELALDIKEQEIINVYGIDAQYFYLTESLCWPILKEIIDTKLMADPAEVNDRMRELSLKLPVNSSIQVVVKFIENVALYYNQVRDLGTLKLNSPEEYVQKYLNEFYLVDLFYRCSLEKYHELITKEIPIEQTINNAKRQLDHEYAKICNILNLEWLTCVKEKGEYFSKTGLKLQQDFYKNESDTSVKQVIIVSDALRYEVASELMQELAKHKNIATLDAYQAMLPTETKYCKPALLPHRTLELQGTEMAVDGVVLTTTEQRTQHLERYRDGAYCVKYDKIMNGTPEYMREVFKHSMVYVFHDTIDDAGHTQNPFDYIVACKRTIEQLSVLVRKLHNKPYNITNIIITSDHGFIYNDINFEDKDKHSITENNIEKKTRYYLTLDKQEVEGVIKFPLESVSGITAPDTYIGVPIGTNRLAASGGYSFAHGGATLQEIIIPVIYSKLSRIIKTEKVGVSLMNHNLNMVSSRLKFQIIQSEAVSMTVMERKIVCCIYNGDDPVTAEKELVLNSPDATNLNNRVFEVTMNLNKSVTSSVLQLRIYDVEDRLNPLVRETVKNNTMIEQDF